MLEGQVWRLGKVRVRLSCPVTGHHLFIREGTDMASTNGVFDLVANDVRFTLVFAQFEGSKFIKGIMIPPPNNSMHVIDGFCDGTDINWERHMADFGTSQYYKGRVNTDGVTYSGTFTQSNMGGVWAWSMQLSHPPDEAG